MRNFTKHHFGWELSNDDCQFFCAIINGFKFVGSRIGMTVVATAILIAIVWTCAYVRPHDKQLMNTYGPKGQQASQIAK